MKLVNRVAASRCRAMGTRPLRSGLLVLVAVVLLTACGVGTGAATSSTPAGSNTIPWLAVPGTPLPPTQPARASIECIQANLRNDGLYAGVYQGNAVENLHLTNTGSTACYFPGVPQLEVTLASGDRVAVSPAGFAAQRVDLQPDQTVQIMFGSPIQCPHANPQKPLVAQSVQVTFSTGGSLTVSGLQLDVQCGSPTVLLFEAIAISTPASSPLSALQAAVTAPSTTSRGSIFTYTVTLTNPTGQAIVLSPCPSYTEGMSHDTTAHDQATWLLNCQVEQQISASSSLTFVMQYVVPSSFPTGAAKLFWALQVPGGPMAGAVVTVN